MRSRERAGDGVKKRAASCIAALMHTGQMFTHVRRTEGYL